MSIPYHLVWCGQRAHDAVGLDRYMDLISILCCDFGLDTSESVKKKNCQIYSLEETSYFRDRWTSANLNEMLEHFSGTIEAYLDDVPEHTCLVAYSATQKLSQLVANHSNIKLVMPEPSLKHQLDSKIYFAHKLLELGLPSVPSFPMRFGAISFAEIEANLGIPFVLQVDRGSSGYGTYFVWNPRDLESMKHLVSVDDDVLASKYVKDNISLNINAAVLGNHVLVSYPSIQLVGLSEACGRPEIYCGNDFSAVALLPKRVINNVQDYATVIGRWLEEIGYQGIYGIDFVVDLQSLKIYAVDLNARFQNSTQLLTQSEMAAGNLPLSFLNVAWQLRLLSETELLAYQTRCDQMLHGSQLILHNRLQTKRIVTGQLSSGIYVPRMNGIERVGEGISLLDMSSDNSVILSCAIPRKSTLVAPEAPLLKIYSWQSLFDLQATRLQPWASKVCEQVLSSLQLMPAEATSG